MLQALGGFLGPALMAWVTAEDRHSQWGQDAQSGDSLTHLGTAHRPQVWIVRRCAEGGGKKARLVETTKGLSHHDRKQVHGAPLKNASGRIVPFDLHFV